MMGWPEAAFGIAAMIALAYAVGKIADCFKD